MNDEVSSGGDKFAGRTPNATGEGALRQDAESFVRKSLKPEDDETLLDAGTATNSAFYDAPISGPDWFIAKVQMAAAFGNKLAGTANWTIGNGPGSLSNKTQQEVADDKAKDDAELFETMMDMVGEREEQERVERKRKWDAEIHDFAGM